MKNAINRAGQLWQNWETKRLELQNLTGIGEEGTLALKRRQYDHLRYGLYRLSASPREQESLHVHAIGAVVNQLQKQLYPQPLLRLLHRLKAALLDKPLHLEEFERQRRENLASLKDELKAKGFASFNGRLEEYLDYETRGITIPITSQLSADSRLDIDLQLISDQTGRYHLQGFEATRKKSGEADRSFAFSQDTGLTATEALNLLEGRAVRKSLLQADGSPVQKWVKLDLTQTQAQWQEYHPAYPFDLKAELAALSQAGVPGLHKEKLLQSLEAGNPLKLEPPGKGAYELQADPAEKRITIYNEAGQPVTLTKLIKDIKPPETTVVRLIKTPAQAQDQSLSAG